MFKSSHSSYNRVKNVKWLLSTILVLALTITLSSQQVVQAQSSGSGDKAFQPQNAIFVELAGNGLLYTINYDRRFNKDFAGRLGLMSAGVGSASLTIVPVMGSYLLGEEHSLELGLGGMYMGVNIEGNGDGFQGISEGGVTGTGTIGYRYQSRDGGFLFRIGLTPVFGSFGMLPWGGLSLGYSF